MTTILEVVQIAPYTSPNNFQCKIVTFEEVQVDEKTGKEIRTGNRASRCLIPDVPVTIINNNVIKWKGDQTLNSISIGESFSGKIKEVNTISRTSNERSSRRIVIFSEDKEVRETAMQLCYFQEYPLDIDNRPIFYARQLMVNLNDNPDEEIEDYTESESDYEDELLDFLTGGDLDYDDFNGDWDDLKTSRGLD